MLKRLLEIPYRRYSLMPRKVGTPFSLNFAARNSEIGLYYSAISEVGGQLEEAGETLQSYFFDEDIAEALVMSSVRLGVYLHLPPHDLLEAYSEDNMVISEENGCLFYSYEKENSEEEIEYPFLHLGFNTELSRQHPMTLEDIIQTDREIGVRYSYVFSLEEMHSMMPNRWYCWAEGHEYPVILKYEPIYENMDRRTEGLRRLTRDYAS